MAEKTEKPKQASPPSEGDLLASELNLLKQQNADLQEQMRSTQLQLQAILGRSQTSEEIADFTSKVLDRREQKRQAGGKYQWRITNRRFTAPDGGPVSHIIWSNARTPSEAVNDFKRRARVNWDVSEGSDPYGAEPVTEKKE